MITLAKTKYFFSYFAQSIIISSSFQGSLWKEIEILPDYLYLFSEILSLWLAANFTALTTHWINKDSKFFPQDVSSDFSLHKKGYIYLNILYIYFFFHLLEKENCERSIVKGSKLLICLESFIILSPRW